MTNEKILQLTLLLTREVARLHASNATLKAVVEELMIVDSRHDKIDAAQIQIDSLQEFYNWVEEFDPEIAALIDNRSERAFDKEGDPDKRFMDGKDEDENKK